VPLRLELGEAQADPRNLAGVEIPDHVARLKIGR